MSTENMRLRFLLEKAENDFSADKFTNEMLAETKKLIVKLASSVIKDFLNDDFKITKPTKGDSNLLLFKIQSNLMFFNLAVDVEGLILIGY